MKTYRVVARVRDEGAIGVSWPIVFIVRADNEDEAKEKAMDDARNCKLEWFNADSIMEVTR